METGGANRVYAAGLFRQGGILKVVRNFSRMPATLHVTADGRSPTLRAHQAADVGRVLTAAETLRGRTLLVNTNFDEPEVSGPYEVITVPVSR